ncbi:MAG TPA: bacillithiol system redox-active protein YtxJ [Chitinophagaceae bacterium]|nr:bacillithiol system redox-active protein YtxJ [Chitinophagaceae bacterium]
MNWIPLKDEAGLAAIKSQSAQQPQVIFKHSTRCGISSMIKNRLEKTKAPGELGFHFLDLIAHRALSNKIADDFGIEHESPQILLIKNGECVYDESHNGISMDDIIESANL